MPADGASGAAVGVAVGWGGAGSIAGASVAGAGAAAVVVMCMTPPRTRPEWTVALISTVLASICGGAGMVEYFGLHAMVFRFTGLLVLFGLAFACGLPAWALVRWAFTWMERRKDRDIGEIADEVRRQIGGGR